MCLLNKKSYSSYYKQHKVSLSIKLVSKSKGKSNLISKFLSKENTFCTL